MEKREPMQQGEEQKRYCPFNGMDCDARCAWRLGEACAAAVIGREAYAAVEAYMLVNRLEKAENNNGGNEQ